MKSRSALTFIELKNKTEDIYEFGNDWGLYIDIEMNYQTHFREIREKKINKIRNTLDKIDEYEDEYLNHHIEIDKEENHKNAKNKNEKNKIDINTLLYRLRKCFRQLFLYLFLAIGLSYFIDNNKNT